MRIYITYVLSVLLSFQLMNPVLAQDQGETCLILKDAKSGSEQYFREYQKIRVWTGEEDKFVGRLAILDENRIKVGDKELKLSEIVTFKSATRKRKIIGGVIVGTPVVLTGAVVAVIMVIEGGFELGSVIFGGAGVVLTAAMAPVGAVVGSSKKKAIDGERYSLRIGKV